MIEIKNVTKKFDNFVAIEDISFNVEPTSIYGLIGYNGAGKTTLLKTVAGIYRADGGEVLLDGQRSFDNDDNRKDLFYIPDDLYFPLNSTPLSMAKFYADYYPNFHMKTFENLIEVFGLDKKKKIRGFSKGMQRQAALILALSTCPKYLFLDEIFDGLDPVVRHLLKKIIIEQVSEHNMTVIIASHNLRELEDLCDRICLMHRGKMLMERDLDSLRLCFRKVQVAFSEIPMMPNIFEGIDVVNVWQNGNVFNVTIRGTEEDVMPQLNALNPAYISAMPLTLEEIFISEMGEAGYDVNSIL